MSNQGPDYYTATVDSLQQLGTEYSALLFWFYTALTPTLQPANFGRVYAAYDGIFIVLSLLWGWKVDNVLPDKFDVVSVFSWSILTT